MSDLRTTASGYEELKFVLSMIFGFTSVCVFGFFPVLLSMIIYIVFEYNHNNIMRERIQMKISEEHRDIQKEYDGLSLESSKYIHFTMVGNNENEKKACQIMDPVMFRIWMNFFWSSPSSQKKIITSIKDSFRKMNYEDNINIGSDGSSDKKNIKVFVDKLEINERETPKILSVMGGKLSEKEICFDIDLEFNANNFNCMIYANYMKFDIPIQLTEFSFIGKIRIVLESHIFNNLNNNKTNHNHKNESSKNHFKISILKGYHLDIKINVLDSLNAMNIPFIGKIIQSKIKEHIQKTIVWPNYFLSMDNVLNNKKNYTIEKDTYVDDGNYQLGMFDEENTTSKHPTLRKTISFNSKSTMERYAIDNIRWISCNNTNNTKKENHMEGNDVYIDTFSIQTKNKDVKIKRNIIPHRIDFRGHSYKLSIHKTHKRINDFVERRELIWIDKTRNVIPNFKEKLSHDDVEFEKFYCGDEIFNFIWSKKAQNFVSDIIFITISSFDELLRFKPYLSCYHKYSFKNKTNKIGYYLCFRISGKFSTFHHKNIRSEKKVKEANLSLSMDKLLSKPNLQISRNTNRKLILTKKQREIIFQLGMDDGNEDQIFELFDMFSGELFSKYQISNEYDRRSNFFTLDIEQERHARLIIQLVDTLSRARYELVPSEMSESCFWYIYFSITKDFF